MKRIKIALGFMGAAILAACTSTSVTPVSNNQFILSTSAAPACSQSSAAGVASKMAAVETLRRGFPRYVILGTTSANNVQVFNQAPTGAFTSGSIDQFGYYESTTTYTGGGPLILGSRDVNLSVLTLQPGDEGYNQAIDAKAVLGENWQTLIDKGIKTCT